MKNSRRNVDETVAAEFGHEWSMFQQDEDNFSASEELCFSGIFTSSPGTYCRLQRSGPMSAAAAAGWSFLVAPRVGHLHLLDASAEALAVARNNLSGAPNTSFHLASAGDMPFDDGSLDFAFSLGVLHHIPDTPAAIGEIASKLKQARRS